MHSPLVFKALVDRERHRAGRLGLVFSILVGTFRKDTLPAVAHRLLTGILARKRSVDDLGWIDEGRLGLLLPATDAAGAQSLLEDLRRQLPDVISRFDFDIHSEPPGAGPERTSREGSRPATREADRAPAPDRNGAPFHCVRSSPFFRPMPPWKRAIDVAGAALGILLTLPLWVLAAAAIRLTGKGPVFFTQVRVTHGGRLFRCLKFRTMVENAAEIQEGLPNEQTGPVFKMRRDPRVTRVGHWLRRSSIDELPQLWNVLRGELSLVGPRPPTPEEVSTYLPWQWERLHVTPGLTCYWQVGGRSEIGFLDWVRMDIRYARRLGFWTDLGILLRTVPAVLSGRGAY